MEDLLQHIQGPEDLRKLSIPQMKELAEQIRQRIIEVVSRNGGHLSSNLGVVELTIAMHYCLNLPEDRLVWDVGHQCYPHKLLTGRNSRFDTLRMTGGVSGFPNPNESPFDLFHVGHAGTAIPTAMGLAKADEESRTLIRSDVFALLGRYEHDGAIRLRSTATVVAGTKP
jgi:1-deoxy-D-xylulose-5-phosphate synthase